MTTTPAEAWAFEFAANGLRDRMAFQGEDLFSVAYNVFDENLEERDADGTRLYLTRPDRRDPAVFVEKTPEGYDFVFEWEGEEKYREELGSEFYDELNRYFK